MQNNEPNSIHRFFLGGVGPLILLALWQVAYQATIFNPTLLPSPIQTIEALFALMQSSYFWESLRQTFYIFVIGYSAAIFVGSFIGIFFGSSKLFRFLAMPVFDFFRSTPVTVLYPIFVLFFGVGALSKTVMVFFSCMLIITVNAAYGVILSNPTRSQTLALFGANGFQVFYHVKLKEALPHIFVGARVALGIALIVVILVEMFMGSDRGLGQLVIEAFTAYETAKLYALIIITGFIGVLLNRLFLLLEKISIPWSYANAAGR